MLPARSHGGSKGAAEPRMLREHDRNIGRQQGSHAGQALLFVVSQNRVGPSNMADDALPVPEAELANEREVVPAAVLVGVEHSRAAGHQQPDRVDDTAGRGDESPQLEPGGQVAAGSDADASDAVDLDLDWTTVDGESSVRAAAQASSHARNAGELDLAGAHAPLEGAEPRLGRVARAQGVRVGLGHHMDRLALAGTHLLELSQLELPPPRNPSACATSASVCTTVRSSPAPSPRTARPSRSAGAADATSAPPAASSSWTARNGPPPSSSRRRWVLRNPIRRGCRRSGSRRRGR